MRFTAALLATLGIFGASAPAGILTLGAIAWGNYSSNRAHEVASWPDQSASAEAVGAAIYNGLGPDTSRRGGLLTKNIDNLSSRSGVDVFQPALTVAHNVDHPAQIPEPGGQMLTGSALIVGGLFGAARLLGK